MPKIPSPLFARLIRALALPLIVSLTSAGAHAQSSNSPQFEVFGVVIVWASPDPIIGGAPVIGDFVVNSSMNSTSADDIDLVSSDVHTVQTGTLVPLPNSIASSQAVPVQLLRLQGQSAFMTDTNGDGVMNDQDSFAAFRIRDASDVRSRLMELSSSFYVASNVPFAIEGVAAPVGSTPLDDLRRIRTWMSVTPTGNDGIPFGAAAQFPHSGGPTAGMWFTGRQLYSIRNPRTVFTGNQRTANGAGSVTDQSVRFDVNYRYNTGNADLSDGTFDIAAEVTYTVYVP